MSKPYNGKFYCCRCHEEVKSVNFTFFNIDAFDCSNRNCNHISKHALTEKGLKEARK